MAATVEGMVLVLEWQINFILAAHGDQRSVDHLRDVIAMRCIRRIPFPFFELEARVDLFLSRGGMSHFRAMRRMAESQGQFAMGFLRALIMDYAPHAMMQPRPVALFRETELSAVRQVRLALLRIRTAQTLARMVDLDDETDVPVREEGDESSVAEDSDGDMSLAALTDPTIEPYDGDGVESVDTDPSEVSMVCHADIADLADLEGCIDDAAAA
jgi:hypothetical protein